MNSDWMVESGLEYARKMAEIGTQAQSRGCIHWDELAQVLGDRGWDIRHADSVSSGIVATEHIPLDEEPAVKQALERKRHIVPIGTIWQEQWIDLLEGRSIGTLLAYLREQQEAETEEEILVVVGSIEHQARILTRDIIRLDASPASIWETGSEGMSDIGGVSAGSR